MHPLATPAATSRGRAGILWRSTQAEFKLPLPSRPELVINLKTARALGIAIPNTLLVLADEVIE